MDRVAHSQYYRQHLSGLTPQQRHQQLLSQALQQPGGQHGMSALHATETDYDALRKHHRFLRGPEDDAPQAANSWGARLARRYYARLFKEYAIADLSRYKESKIGLRWRTQAEVVAGKGQFTCGAKGCDSTAELCAYEVNFAYQEAGQHKQALVKLCLCEDCACRLNYRREKAKQYKKLGASSAFDQQQEQQQQQQQQRERGQEREAERDRRHKGKSSSSRRGRNDGEADESLQRRGRHEQQQQQQQQQEWDSPERGRGSDRAPDTRYRQRERSQEPQRDREWGSDRMSGGEFQRDRNRVCSNKAVRDDVSDGKRPHAAASAGAARAGALDTSSKAGVGGGRWQMGGEGGGEDRAAAAGGDVGLGGASASDRWELHDGDLNDADIERWLDSLFTAVEAGRKT